jgi:hypothetical protein
MVTGFDLRPLSLGEILDRTFSLFRGNFLLFIGIAAIPQVLVLAIQLLQIALQRNSPGGFGSAGSWGTILITLLVVIVSTVAYLYSQGGTILAVSEIYLGRGISIIEALGKVQAELGFLFGVAVLNGLAVMGGVILLIIPGIYVACRLLVCVPVALIEQRGPRESLTRAWELTKGYAGRAFMMFLMFFVIAIAANLLFTAPASLGLAQAVRGQGIPWTWVVLTQVGAHVAGILTQPVLLIATSIFYYDLRVRKEAFDLELMMNPGSSPAPPSGSVPSIL